MKPGLPLARLMRQKYTPFIVRWKLFNFLLSCCGGKFLFRMLTPRLFPRRKCSCRLASSLDSISKELLGSHGSATSSITAVEVSKEFYDNDEYCEVEPPAPPIPELEDIRPSSPSIGRVDDDDATNGYPRDHGCGDSNGGSVEPTAPPMVDEEAKVAAEVAAEVAAVAAAFEAAAETPSTRELTPHLLEADASNANAYSLTVFRQNKQVLMKRKRCTDPYCA